MRNVSLSEAKVISAALHPRYGGQIVEELVTIKCVNEGQDVFRWSDGYVVELCNHGAYVSRIGQSGSFLVDVELIARAGGEWPESYVITSSVENETSNRTETVLLQADEVEEAFFEAEALASGTFQRPKFQSRAEEVDRDFDRHFAAVSL
jgi:hypothetical protein